MTSEAVCEVVSRRAAVVPGWVPSKPLLSPRRLNRGSLDRPCSGGSGWSHMVTASPDPTNESMTSTNVDTFHRCGDLIDTCSRRWERCTFTPSCRSPRETSGVEVPYLALLTLCVIHSTLSGFSGPVVIDRRSGKRAHAADTALRLGRHVGIDPVQVA